MSDSFDVKTPTTTHRVTRTGNVLYIVNSTRPDADHIIEEMHNYWQGLRRNGSVPLRADVSADDIPTLLEYAFLIERLAPGMARFRLVGQHLIDLMGMELRGMPLCSLLNRDSRKRMCHVTETVFRAPQIAELKLSSPAEERSGMKGTMLLLPLRSDLDDVTRALGCLVMKGTGGTRPQRLDLTGTKFTPVIPGGRILHPSSLTDSDKL